MSVILNGGECGPLQNQKLLDLSLLFQNPSKNQPNNGVAIEIEVDAFTSISPLRLQSHALEILSKSKLERCVKSDSDKLDCEKVVINLAVPSDSVSTLTFSHRCCS